MGFFSQNCEGCGHPLLSVHAVNQINQWMVNVVAISPSGSIVRGEYDGYGRVIDGNITHDCAVGYDSTTWHEACWLMAGRPSEYTGQSDWASDQGFFFTDEHDMAEPQ